MSRQRSFTAPLPGWKAIDPPTLVTDDWSNQWRTENRPPSQRCWQPSRWSHHHSAARPPGLWHTLLTGCTPSAKSRPPSLWARVPSVASAVIYSGGNARLRVRHVSFTHIIYIYILYYIYTHIIYTYIWICDDMLWYVQLYLDPIVFFGGRSGVEAPCLVVRFSCNARRWPAGGMCSLVLAIQWLGQIRSTLFFMAGKIQPMDLFVSGWNMLEPSWNHQP